jgi:hypothetical protein
MNLKEMVYQYLDNNYNIKGNVVQLNDYIFNVDMEIRSMFGTRESFTQLWAKDRTTFEHIIHEVQEYQDLFTYLEGSKLIKSEAFSLNGKCKRNGTYLNVDINYIYFTKINSEWVEASKNLYEQVLYNIL